MEEESKPVSVASSVRTERIIGADGVRRLREASVLVLGLGGVGSNCVEALARGGVGTIVAVDHDVVQASNINRQAIAFRNTIGMRKIDAMRDMVAHIDPTIRFQAKDLFVLPENIEMLLDDCGRDIDYVVDAIDTVATKLALAKIAERDEIRLVSSMGAANKLHPESLRFADIYDTVNCPLCRVVRKEARKRGIAHLQVLYSCEHAVQVPNAAESARHDRSNLGTMSYFPPIMGQMIAGKVIRDLLGMDDEADESDGRVLWK